MAIKMPDGRQRRTDKGRTRFKMNDRSMNANSAWFILDG